MSYDAGLMEAQKRLAFPSVVSLRLGIFSSNAGSSPHDSLARQRSLRAKYRHRDYAEKHDAFACSSGSLGQT